MRKLRRTQQEKDAEQREIRKLNNAIIKELDAPGGYYSPIMEAFVTAEGVLYPREYLEDNRLTRYIPSRNKPDEHRQSMDRQERRRT